MIYTSLAVLAMSASSALSPLSSLVHLHPRTRAADDRVSVTLINTNPSFRDLQVDGHTYTVEPLHTLTIKAPAGTLVYAASKSARHRRGDTLLQLTPTLDRQTLRID